MIGDEDFVLCGVLVCSRASASAVSSSNEKKLLSEWPSLFINMLSLTLRERWLNVVQSRMYFGSHHWPLVAA